MKLFLSIILVTILYLFLNTPMAISQRVNSNKNLYQELSRRYDIKIYIAEIKNSSNNADVDVTSLKKLVEKAVEERITIDFRIVSDKTSADIVVYCDVLNFVWSDRDPLDNVAVIGPIIMDAFSVDKYVRLEADFVVKSADKDEELWHKSLRATVTSKTMTYEESIFLVNERLVKIFMRECFSKPHG